MSGTFFIVCLVVLILLGAAVYGYVEYKHINLKLDLEARIKELEDSAQEDAKSLVEYVEDLGARIEAKTKAAAAKLTKAKATPPAASPAKTPVVTPAKTVTPAPSKTK